MNRRLLFAFVFAALLIIPMGALGESMGSGSYNTSGAVTGGGGNTTSTNFLTFLYNLLTGGNTSSSSYQTAVGQFYEIAAGEEVNCNPPEGAGDWDIDGHVKCVSRTIDIDGDINILAGDHLELDNVTLMVNLSVNSEHIVIIDNGGILTVYNYSTLKDDEGTQLMLIRLGQNSYSVMNLSHTYVGNNLYVYVYNATLYLTDDSRIDYRVQLYNSAAKVVSEGSTIDTAFLYTYSNVTMRDFRTNVNHTSSTVSEDGSFAYNVTDSVTSTLYMDTCYSGGPYMTIIDNSTMTQVRHYSTADCDLNYTKSTVSTFIIQAQVTGGSLVLSDIPDSPSSWTDTYSNANGGDIFIDDGSATYVYLYSSVPCTIDNCTFYSYYAYGTADDYFKDSGFTNLIYSQASGAKSTFENTGILVTNYASLAPSTTWNFTQPATNSEVARFRPLTTGTRTIYGYVNFTSLYTGSFTDGSNLNVNRYFPINVTTDSGAPLPDMNVSIWQGGSLLNYSTTGSDGMITAMNITDDDNTTVYELYLEDTWKKNITMLEPTAPYGIQLTEEAPTVSDVVLSASGGNNYTTENLSVSFSSLDPEGRTVYNITDWRLGGTSIALVNMPFDTSVSFTATGAVKDYSTYGNDGTLGAGASDNAPAWTEDGKVGGAYRFDGVNDYISCGSDVLFDSSKPVTVSFWADLNGYNVQYPVALRLKSEQATGLIFFYCATGGYTGFNFGSNANFVRLKTAGDISSSFVGQWKHMTMVYDGVSRTSDSSYKLYINGVEQSLVASSSFAAVPLVNVISSTTANNQFNGTIDELKIFDRALSPEQIKALYGDGMAGHHSELIVSQETSKGETWTVAVTPSDSYADGSMAVSNAVTIENTPPGKVTLSAPEGGNTTTERTPQFSWEEIPSDPDGDTLIYHINFTCGYSGGGTDCSDDNREYAVGSGNCTGDGFCNYTIPAELKYFGDDNYYYNWTVLADDGTDNSSWSDTWNITINTDVSITLYNSTVTFGSISIAQSNDTEDNSPEPFRLRNNGNSFVDVNISSENLIWETSSSPSGYYMYKIANVTGEEWSLNWSSSNTTSSWTPIPVVNGSAISFFNYSDATDEAEIDLYIEVPPGEPAGVKTSNIVFTAGYVSEYS